VWKAVERSYQTSFARKDKKEARIKAQDFVFQVPVDQPKKLKDQLEVGTPVRQPHRTKF